ncbi:MAG: PQQ-dependent sugar dehydrogenase, partial [Patescibacteria group bacterium]
INAQGKLQSEPVATFSNAKEIGEGGLLGIAVHHNFSKNHYLYFYYTYSSSSNGDTLNRVVRRKFENAKLSVEEIIVDAIPGNANHNGGRIKFGPDNMLYITTGDAQEPSHAQDKLSLAGKILRVTDTGEASPGNPFNNRTYSYGHRNPQGIAWDQSGQLWATEHGRSGIQSGLDELNKIEKGKNYGWPDSEGIRILPGTVGPVLNSGASSTWAPAGMAFYNNTLYFGGLRGAALYKVKLPVSAAEELMKDKYGRIRDVVLGPDNKLYITTSNLDGRGSPRQGDDLVLEIDTP